MSKTWLLFCSLLIVAQNARTQSIYHGKNCPKLFNQAINQLLTNSCLNLRPTNNAVPTESSNLLSLLNGQYTQNVNKVLGTAKDFGSTNHVANCGPRLANNARINNHLPNPLASNDFFNELLAKAIAEKTSDTPIVKSNINNKLFKNGIQYNVGIQIDKMDLLNKILNKDTTIGSPGILDTPKEHIVPEFCGTAGTVNNVNGYSNTNNYNTQYPDNLWLAYHETLQPKDLSIDNMLKTNMGLQKYIPILNNVPLVNMQNSFGINNHGIESLAAINGYYMPVKQLNANLPINNAINCDISSAFLPSSLNSMQLFDDPSLNTLFIEKEVPVSNSQYENNAPISGNLYNPSLYNILSSNRNEFQINEIPFSNIDHGMPVPTLSNIPNIGLQYNQNIPKIDGCSTNNPAAGNTANLNLNQMNSVPSGNLYPVDQSLLDIPSIISCVDAPNTELDIPTNLGEWNMLNLGQYGSLPIINGLPVVGITETITVINPNL